VGDIVMTDAQDTAANAVADGEWAFRLKAETPVYELPGSGTIIAVLPAGAIVTAQERSGEFLRIITPQDSFGFIPASTPVEEIEPMSLAPPPPPEPERSDASVEAASAFRAQEDAISARRAADRDWRPEPLRIEDAQRILIYDRIDQNKRGTFVILGGFVIFLALFFGAIGAVIGFSSSGTFSEQLTIALVTGVIAGGIGLVIASIMYRSSTAIVMGISGAHEVDKQEEPVLYRVVENLSIGSGLPMPKVWVIEDSAPNAFATGRNPGAAHVAATRGLLDKLEKRELEAVMAHEVSHVGNYDTRIMTIVAVVIGLVALLSDVMLRFTRFGAGMRMSNRDKGGGALALVIIMVSFFFIAMSPLIASLMRLALSRQREYLADASGALLSRNPDALADALLKISADPEPLEVANKATAHLYLANPLKGHESFLNNLFATHPPVEERVRILRAM
jgi:heat shock protein HtpX